MPMLTVIRYAALGVIGFMTPRILVGVGVPLDAWGISLGEWLGLSKPWLQEWGLIVAGLTVALVLTGIEAWWGPIKRLWGAIIARSTDKDVDKIRVQAELKRQNRLQHKQDQLDKGLRGAGAHQSEEDRLTWFELEQRFKELEVPLQFTRIDGQTGDAGEYWRLAGKPSGDAERRFRAIAAMASTRLSQDFPSEIRRFPDLESESDPVIRWYKALKFIAGRYEEGRYAEQFNDDGSPGGLIFMGSIQQPATASATLCLELASRPVEQA